MSKHAYNNDVVAWAEEQAKLLRAGKFEELDIDNIAEEIEDVGKSEQRELDSRLVVLIAHLLKCKYQPERKSRSWENAIKTQRKLVLRRLKKTPSLKRNLSDDECLEDIWEQATLIFDKETGLTDLLPKNMPFSIEQVLSEDFFV